MPTDRLRLASAPPTPADQPTWPSLIVDEAPPASHWLAAARAEVGEEIASAAARLSPAVHVSVIIPTYQHQHLIVAAAEQALNQVTPFAHEVIVVDDGSTDETSQRLIELVHTTTGRLRYVRLPRNMGRSTARNAGIDRARGQILAFTDSDCRPTPSWLAAGVAALATPSVGIIQGETRPNPHQRQVFFSHFIETVRLDGTYCTSNVFYRREAILAAGGFDPAIDYWQDADLGWRVWRSGWSVAFEASALVYHEVIPLSPLRWLRWTTHYAEIPAILARYPEHRRYLFAGLWVDWHHALLCLALVALSVGLAGRRRWLSLALPYLLTFPRRHGLRGQWPAAKAVFHLLWDLLAILALLISSLRHRTPAL